MKRVLIFYPGALGDLALSVPVLSALREAYPDVTLHLVGSLPQANLLRLWHLVDALSSYDDPFFLPLFSDSPLPPALRTWLENFDTLVFCQRGGLHSDLKTGENVFLLNPRPEPHPPVHHAQFLYGACRAFFDLPRRNITDFSLGRKESDSEKSFLLVHPGSGSPEKNWPLENFEVLAARWQRRTRGTVHFLLGPAEQHLMERLEAQRMKFKIDRLPALPDLLRLLERATCYFGNDSGVSHLAGLLGLRGLVFFRATDPAIWRPLGKSLLPVLVE